MRLHQFGLICGLVGGFLNARAEEAPPAPDQAEATANLKGAPAPESVGTPAPTLADAPVQDNNREPASKKKKKKKNSTTTEDQVLNGTPPPPAVQSMNEAPPQIGVNKEAKAVQFSAKDVWNVDIFKEESNRVIVIQDRKYTKASKFEIGLDLGTMNSSPFYTTYTYGVHADYHLSEYFGIEAFFDQAASSLSSEGSQLDQFLAAHSFPAGKEFQSPTFFSGVGLMWSPIYGKFAFFRQSIIHFDIYGILGISVIKLHSEFRGASNAEASTDQTLPGSLLGAGMRVFLTKHLSTRLEVRNNIYRSTFAPVETGGSSTTLLRTSFDFNLGFSFLFGGE